jgi:cytochrome c oxidase accessory protein FixG
MACVNVCPMGIDIRDGQQMACITCGLCIDACDDVMDRIGKPRGLIGYMALSDHESERSGKAPKSVWKHVFRPRTMVYTAIWSVVGIGLIVALFIRADLDMSVSPVRNPTHIVLSDGTVRNVYDVRLRNMANEEREFVLSITENPDLRLSVEGEDATSITLSPDEMAQVRVYLEAPNGTASAAAPRSTVRIWSTIAGSQDRVYSETVFNGRGQ